MAPWQKDVRALQALWRDCGNAYIQMFLAMKGSIWTDVFLFDGTQAEWTITLSPISAGAADDCVSCDLGSRSSVDNTRCVEVVNAPGSGLDGDGGSSTNATDEYNNLLASYVAAARDNAKTPATAVGFFILLGVVATCCGLFTGWYRRRRIRLRQLALEREYLIEEAESDMQRGKPPRRATIYALAGVVSSFLLFPRGRFD